MTCAEFQNRLSAFTDGELSRWTRWKVQVHLDRCPQCAGLMHELDEVDSAIMGVLADCEGPAYLDDAVMRRLPAMPPPWRRQGAAVRWAAGAALAGVQIMAVFGAYAWGFAKGTSIPQRGQQSQISSPSLGGSLGTASWSAPINAPGKSPDSGANSPRSIWTRTNPDLQIMAAPEPKPAAPSKPKLRTPKVRLPETQRPLQLHGAY